MEQSKRKILQRASIVTALISLIGSATSSSLAQGSDFPGTGSKDDWLKANGYYMLGDQAYAQKNYKEAATQLQEAIKIYPHDWNYHFKLGLALKKSGYGAKAVDSFKAASDLNKSDFKVWKGLANSYYQVSRFEEAKDAYKKALECNPPAKEVAEIKTIIQQLSN